MSAPQRSTGISPGAKNFFTPPTVQRSRPWHGAPSSSPTTSPRLKHSSAGCVTTSSQRKRSAAWPPWSKMPWSPPLRSSPKAKSNSATPLTPWSTRHRRRGTFARMSRPATSSAWPTASRSPRKALSTRGIACSGSCSMGYVRHNGVLASPPLRCLGLNQASKSSSWSLDDPTGLDLCGPPQPVKVDGGLPAGGVLPVGNVRQRLGEKRTKDDEVEGGDVRPDGAVLASSLQDAPEGVADF